MNISKLVRTVITLSLAICFCGFLLSCTSGVDPENQDDPVAGSLSTIHRSVNADEASIHDQHASVSCGTCHQHHGDLFPTRDTCLLCHEIPGLHMTHVPQPLHVRCTDCHTDNPPKDFPPTKDKCTACHTNYTGYLLRYECNDCHWPK